MMKRYTKEYKSIIEKIKRCPGPITDYLKDVLSPNVDSSSDHNMLKCVTPLNDARMSYISHYQQLLSHEKEDISRFLKEVEGSISDIATYEQIMASRKFRKTSGEEIKRRKNEQIEESAAEQTFGSLVKKIREAAKLISAKPGEDNLKALELMFKVKKDYIVNYEKYKKLDAWKTGDIKTLISVCQSCFEDNLSIVRIKEFDSYKKEMKALKERG